MIKRDEYLNGFTRRVKTGCGWMYVTVNNNTDREPFEVFLNIGKAGGCAASQAEAIGRLVSLLLRNKVPIEKVKEQMKGISCHLPIHEGAKSCSDAISMAIEGKKDEILDNS